MKTYASKSSAKKGAVRQGLEVSALNFAADNDGRWSWSEVEQEVEECVIGEFTHCPHCEVHLSNGVLDNADHYEELKQGKMAKEIKEMEEGTTAAFCCLGCGEDFGPALSLVPTVGLKIEKDRPEQNGIVRPSVGGKCRAIWDACDELLAAGTVPMPKILKEMAVQNDWNQNNTVIEMYQWRKFNGFVGRQK